jgi:hypothetical protein
VFRDNIITRGSYGVIGDNMGEGLASLNRYCRNWDFAYNVLIGFFSSSYPPLTRFVATIPEAQFVDANSENYRLAPGSPCCGAGTNGGDPGIDMNGLRQATRGVVEGLSAPSSVRVFMDGWQ